MSNSKVGAAFTVDNTSGEVTSRSVGVHALKAEAADADSLEVSATTGKMQVKDAGTSKAAGVKRAQVSKFAGFWIQGDLDDGNAAGDLLTEENTYGSDLMVLRLVLLVTTGSTGASRADGGVNAAVATDDDLIDGVTLTASGSTIVADNIQDKGTNGGSRWLWASGAYITGSMKTGDCTGLVGTYAIYCVDMN